MSTEVDSEGVPSQKTKQGVHLLVVGWSVQPYAHDEPANRLASNGHQVPTDG